MKKNEKNIQNKSWKGISPFETVILEIFFSNKLYLYIGITIVCVPLFIFPFIFFMFFNTQIFGKVMMVFIISSSVVNVTFWAVFLVCDPPKVRGAIILTLLEFLVITRGRVFFQMKWEDIKRIELIKERIQTYDFPATRYKLKIFSSNSLQVLRLWSISVSKRKTKLLIDSIKNIAYRKKIDFITHYHFDELTMIEAREICKDVRNFMKGN